MAERAEPTYRLRPMVEADLEPVAALEARVAPEPWSRALFAAEFDVDPMARHWLVAVSDEPSSGPAEDVGDGTAVVAFAGVMIIADEAHLMNVATDPAHRRRGLARRLVWALAAEAADRGAAAMTLEVRASNHGARALYRELGFEEAGRRPRYYGDGEDALILWLHRLHRELRRRGPHNGDEAALAWEERAIR